MARRGAQAAGALSLAIVVTLRAKTASTRHAVPMAAHSAEPIAKAPAEPAMAYARPAMLLGPGVLGLVQTASGSTPEFEPAPEPDLEPEFEPPPVPDPEPEFEPESEPELEPASLRWAWQESWGFEEATPTTPRSARSRTRRGRRTSLRRAALALVAFACVVVAGLGVQHSASAGTDHKPQRAIALPRLAPPPSGFALQTIPNSYLRIYWRAGEEYGLDWTKLAAVGQIESDSGRSHQPGVLSGTNSSGAAGPAQFLSRTWARYGVDANGRGLNPYDPADAIVAMAAYLKASGAPEDWRAALYAYDHSESYVQAVLALSLRLQASSG
jgi:Transglycosylase SLT domain